MRVESLQLGLGSGYASLQPPSYHEKKETENSFSIKIAIAKEEQCDKILLNITLRQVIEWAYRISGQE